MRCAHGPGVEPGVPPDAADAVARAGFELVRCERNMYGMIRPGRREPGDGELSAWQGRVSEQLTRLEGIYMVGVGACCRRGGAVFSPEGCLVVYLDQHTPAARQLPGVVARLVDETGAGDMTLRVSVEQSPPRRPRCAPAEPGCGPIRYDRTCVDARATETRTRRLFEDDRGDEPLDTCTHDGECQTCNMECMSYRAGTTMCTLLDASEPMKDVQCGCVQGRCSWFRFD
jgi:hypothetical protein